MHAIDKTYDTMSDFELAEELSRIAAVQIPAAIEEIRTAPRSEERRVGKECRL